MDDGYVYPPFRHVRERNRKIKLVMMTITVLVTIGLSVWTYDFFSFEEQPESTPVLAPHANATPNG